MPSRSRRAVPPARRTAMAVVTAGVLIASAVAAGAGPAAVADGPPTPVPVASAGASPVASSAASPSPSAIPSAEPGSAEPSTAASSVPSPPAPPPDRVDRQSPRKPPWDACPRPVWPGQRSAGEPGAGRRVLVIGDSLTRESRVRTAAWMRASGWTPTFRCWGSRRLDWGIDQVRRSRDLGQLPAFVIIALGTNDISWETPATTERRARDLLDRLGPQRQVLWVDLHLTRSAWLDARAAWFNGLLRQLAREYPTLTVVPWHRVARGQGIRGWDGIHYGPSGYRLRARTVAAALDRLGRQVPAVDVAASAEAPGESPVASVAESPAESAATLRD